MNVFEHFRGHVMTAIQELGAEGKFTAATDTSRVSVEPPKEEGHGDLTTNAAMVLTKQVQMKPKELAWALVERLTDLDFVMSAEVAGPGFINVKLQDDFWRERLGEVLKAGPSYGDSKIGQGRPVNVEYVSANPTGPLHVGHGRGAVVGDALCGLLEKAGYAVTREYYINDAGAQVDALAKSAYFRYWQERDPKIDAAAFAAKVGEKELQYGGDYLVPVGKALYAKYKDMLAFESDWLPVVRQFTIDAMMDLIREDLAVLGVKHKVFTSERHDLVEKGRVDEAFQVLEKAGHIYTGTLEPPKGKTIEDWEPRPQVLFRATAFGDDVDRPLKKSDGSWTYFANDIANHQDKFRRGFNLMINIWGADHGGYVKRVQAAVKALTAGKGEVDVKLCQLVSLMDAGQPVKMSKRAGTFVTLREVVDKVGRDVVRFIMLTRKNDAQLEFDLTKVTEQSRENPVFYVQYAHARVHSVLRHAATLLGAESIAPEALAGADLWRLTDPGELGLIKRMAAWPRLVENAAEAHEPHRVAFYLHDLASAFHALWNKGNDDSSLRFIREDDPALTRARLALIRGVAFVIASGLAVMGVTPLEELRS